MNHHVVISPWLAEWVTGDSQETLMAEIQERVPDCEIEICDRVGAFAEALKGADVLLTNRLPSRFYEDVDGLSWMQVISAGVDHYDLDALGDAGVVVTNASGVHGKPIAEHVLGYMLAFERKILTGIEQQRDRQWVRYQPGELTGKTLCVVGLGAIGSEIARIGDALGMEVVGIRGNPDRGSEYATEVRGADDLDSLLPRADYIVLACPLTEETRNLFGTDEFVSMKQSAVLVNIARGAVVGEEALIAALSSGRISGAALDVTEQEPLPKDSPLWSMPNVLVTPHVAGLTPRYWERIADIFAENYADFVDGKLNELRNQVI